MDGRFDGLRRFISFPILFSWIIDPFHTDRLCGVFQPLWHTSRGFRITYFSRSRLHVFSAMYSIEVYCNRHTHEPFLRSMIGRHFGNLRAGFHPQERDHLTTSPINGNTRPASLNVQVAILPNKWRVCTVVYGTKIE